MRGTLIFLVLLAIVFVDAGGCLAQASPPEAEPPSFTREIRPLLSDRCFRCHGPDAATREADLRLDLEESAKRARDGGPALVPGSPERSQLWLRITDPEEATRMPPKDSHLAAFTEAEQGLVRRWIAGGAPYEVHWAFIAPKPPAPPETRAPEWIRNEVDRFILSKLEAVGAAPNPDAPPGILLRRLFLVLTGLPPTAEELRNFVAAPSEAAYQEWIRRLQEEEPYRTRSAEHLTRPWLDAARYADTIGIHTDNGRSLWPWRDRVIESFRTHLPFDRFVQEQLAGDLLPDATQATQVASGFNRSHVITDEGGAISEEYLVEYAVDRTSTFGTVFLGLTLGCARCHDHKYDPISQADFFSLYAFFNSIEEPGLYSQLQNPERAFEPAMSVPTAAQSAEQEAVTKKIQSTRSDIETRDPEEDEQFRRWLSALAPELGLSHAVVRADSARSNRREESITVEPDGSFFVTGEVAETADHTFVISTDAQDLRLITLHAMADPRLPGGNVGRAPNGNAVLTGITVTASSVQDPTVQAPVALRYGVADLEQMNGDFAFVNALRPDERRGWAVDGHRVKGDRVAWMLAETPFGYPGGTRLEIHLQYRSGYPQHQFGRVHFGLAALREEALDRFPVASSTWHEAGPFKTESTATAYASALGPEADLTIADGRPSAGGSKWRVRPLLLDGSVHSLPAVEGVSFVGRDLWAPAPRKVQLSLGSDDGLVVFRGGEEVFRREIDRSAAPDQDQLEVSLAAGAQSLVLKVVNSGGEAGFAYRRHSGVNELAGSLLYGLMESPRRNPAQMKQLGDAWRLRFSPRVQAAEAALTALRAEEAALVKAIPRTMVMKELAKPKPTFVLKRGRYDLADPERETPRELPKVFGPLPVDLPRNRLGLAQWLTREDHPLLARVTVNRLFEVVFGVALVRTPEDFGLQGELPTHPELLDFLATSFVKDGFSVPRLMKMLVSSHAFRQSSDQGGARLDFDPEHRLLGRYPRRRLAAEELRDQALFLGGLMVEATGGPSVRPYQPAGLWEEVSMLQSNTRTYAEGKGSDLFRRSLYTYWKRASPPPTMLLLDAPTRESCQVRRHITNTPLQALALWNDPQFFEAARAFAEAALATSGDDLERFQALSWAATGRSAGEAEVHALEEALRHLRERFRNDVPAAERVLAVGTSMRTTKTPPEELAAWTLIAQAILCSDACLTRT